MINFAPCHCTANSEYMGGLACSLMLQVLIHPTLVNTTPFHLSVKWYYSVVGSMLVFSSMLWISSTTSQSLVSKSDPFLSARCEKKNHHIMLGIAISICKLCLFWVNSLIFFILTSWNFVDSKPVMWDRAYFLRLQSTKSYCPWKLEKKKLKSLHICFLIFPSTDCIHLCWIVVDFKPVSWGWAFCFAVTVNKNFCTVISFWTITILSGALVQLHVLHNLFITLFDITQFWI